MFVDELRQSQSAGHPRRPAADDDNVGGHLRTFDILDRFTKNQHKKRWPPMRDRSSWINHCTPGSVQIRVDPWLVLRSCFCLLYFFNQRRDNVEQIPNHSEVCDLENG